MTSVNRNLGVYNLTSWSQIEGDSVLVGQFQPAGDNLALVPRLRRIAQSGQFCRTGDARNGFNQSFPGGLGDHGDVAIELPEVV